MAAAQDEGKCRGAFSAGCCPKGSNASAELCNGYCKACWNKEKREYADAVAASKQNGTLAKTPVKCLDGKCPRNYNAKPELHNGFCQPCWDKYTRKFEAASKAADAAAAAALKKEKATAAAAAAAAATKQSKSVAGPKTAAKLTAAAGHKPAAVQPSAPAAKHADTAAPAKSASKGKQALNPADSSGSSNSTAGRQVNSRGDGPAAATRAQTKDKIPTAVRNQVWLLYMGNAAFGPCPCCSLNQISLAESGGFECGHVQAEAKGGKTCLGNMILVCKSCNLGMKTEHMLDYVQKFYPHRHKHLQQLHAKVVTMLQLQQLKVK